MTEGVEEWVEPLREEFDEVVEVLDRDYEISSKSYGVNDVFKDEDTFQSDMSLIYLSNTREEFFSNFQHLFDTDSVEIASCEVCVRGLSVHVRPLLEYRAEDETAYWRVDTQDASLGHFNVYNQVRRVEEDIEDAGSCPVDTVTEDYKSEGEFFENVLGRSSE